MSKRYNRIKRLVKEDQVSYTGTRDFNGGWRKKILSESDWTPIAGSIANSTAQTFVHTTGATTTVSGLGGVETTPSTVTIDAFGDTFDVPAPEYGQLGMQGYAPPLGGVQRKTQQTEDEKIDAEQRKLEEQIKQLEQKRNDLLEEQTQKEPKYVGLTNDQLLDRKKEISKKWKQKQSEIIWRSKMSDSEIDAAWDKYYEYEDARRKELNAVEDQSKRDEAAHIQKLKAHIDAYSKKRESIRNKENALYAKIAELEKQRPINQQLDASQQAYPNLPFMGARVDNQFYQMNQMGMINPSAYADAMKSVVNVINPSLPYKVEIAQSVLSNEPIEIPQSEISKSHIKGLINGIENDSGLMSQLMQTYTNTPTPYSDENIYELPNGEVRAHTPETRKLYPDNTRPVGDGTISNPIAGAGQAQMELVDPKDGQPYIKYRDHAYHNLKSKDTGELPDFLSNLASGAIHSLAGKNNPETPNTGAMSNYPSNIKGDVYKTIIIPYSEMGPKLRRAVNDKIGVEQQRAAGINVGSPEVNTGTGRDGTFGRGTYGQGRSSDLASQASSAVGIKSKKKEEEEMVESTWSRLKKYRSIKEHQTPYTGKRNLTGGWRKKILSESDWTPIAGSIANSTAQTFVHTTGATTTVSGLGGVESTPSTVTIGFEGETFDVLGPNYSQLGLQGYAPPLGKKVMKRDAEQNKERRAELDAKLNKLSLEPLKVQQDFYDKWNKIKKALPPMPKSLGIYMRLDPVKALATMDLNAEERDYLKALAKYEKDFESAKKNDLGKKLDSIAKERESLEKEYDYLLGMTSDVNPKLDASQQFAQNVDSDYMMNARVQGYYGEFTPEQTAAMDAWNAELNAIEDKHQREWDAMAKKDAPYDWKKYHAVQLRHAAEMDAILSKKPKFDDAPSFNYDPRSYVPPDPSVPLDYDPFKGVDAPDPSVPLDYNPPEPTKVDPYADRILELNVALDKMKEKGTLISRYKLIGPGEEGYVDTTKMANAIGYNRKPIYTAPAQEMFAELERLYALQLAWLEKQNPGGAVPGADDALDDYNRSMGPNSEPPEDPDADEGEGDDNELINNAIDLLNLGLDVAAVAGILFPEPGTTAGGLARLATRGQRYGNIIGKALQWYNKGRRPGEHKMSRVDRFRDEMSQRQRTSADPNSSWNPLRGMPGYGTAKSKLNPRIRAINNRRASQGKSPLSMDKINPGGAQTGPTPSFRQAIERQSSGTVNPLNKSYVRRKSKEEEEKRR